MDYQLARFKAKYGISYAGASLLFGKDVATIRDWINEDSAPDEINEKIRLYDHLAEHVIKEGKALGDHAPYIQVLEHDKEVALKHIQALTNQIDHLSKPMTFIERLVFLFTGEAKPKLSQTTDIF